jgi:ParB family transcriptional regulator, chromosome partitioning protein
VVAGERRRKALNLLAKSGRIPADHPINCEVVDAAKAYEISLAENAMREQMHPADQHEAIEKLARDGMGEETIAAWLGTIPAVVRQRRKIRGALTEEHINANQNKLAKFVTVAAY